MFGELMGGEDPGRGNPEQSWLICLKDDLKAFGATSVDGGGEGEGGGTMARGGAARG